jgi:hypothetical protein
MDIRRKLRKSFPILPPKSLLKIKKKVLYNKHIAKLMKKYIFEKKRNKKMNPKKLIFGHLKINPKIKFLSNSNKTNLDKKYYKYKFSNKILQYNNFS